MAPGVGAAGGADARTAPGTGDDGAVIDPGTAPAPARRIAYQGEPGAYSEEMVIRVDPTAVAQPEATFAQVVAALVAGQVDRAVLPIENSLAGVVQEVSDQLSEHPVHIVAEHLLPVRHCLLGFPGPPVVRVRSHPQALGQCRHYLTRLGAVPVPAPDTAGAARQLAEDREPGTAVIASAAAAGRYGLTVLAEGIQDRDDNTTRFVSVERGPAARPGDAGIHRGKVSITLETAHQPGGLYTALGAFARRDLNLTRLDARPVPDRPWEYRFYLDFEYEDPQTATGALAELEESAHTVRILGTYPTAS